MVQSFFDKSKKHFLIDFFIYLLPIAIIAGQFISNTISIIIGILFIVLYLTKKIKKDFTKFFYFFFFLLVIFFFNILFSNNPIISTRSSIGFFRYYFMFLGFLYCFYYIDSFEKNFTKVLFFSLIFVIFDGYIQYVFGRDIFNIPITHNRLSGPFGSELIIGAFVSKLIFLSLSFLFLKKINIHYIFFFLCFSFFLVVLSNERSSSIMFLFSLIIFFIFISMKFIPKIIYFFSVIFFLFFLMMFSNAFKDRFVYEPINYYKDNHHKAHFLTAIEIFKNYKITGAGIKNFRLECSKKKYENIDTVYVANRCTTHPHNFYLEILSETGIIGISIIILINLYFFQYLVVNFFNKKEYREEILLVFCAFVVLFFPFQTTGSFFSSFNGIFYWIFFSFFYNLKKKLTKFV